MTPRWALSALRPAPHHGSVPESAYAIKLADDSYDWYLRAAIKARRYYRLSETLQLVISAAIPVAAVLSPGNATAPAVLGAVLVVLTGLRSVFHWHDDYLRFSSAREAVEAERRRYLTDAEPYRDPHTKDATLITAITRIERQEMDVWIKIAARRPGEAKDGSR